MTNFVYLQQILPSKLHEIFRESLETELLCGIINVFKTQFVAQKEPILPWLTGLSRVKRISAVTLFLPSDKKSGKSFDYNYIMF